MPEALDVKGQLLELLGDPSVRQQVLGGLAFDQDSRAMLENLNAQVGAMLQDSSLGGIMNGSLWLSGTSVVNGTITAPKISVTDLEAINTSTGSLNVTGDFIAATTFPATGARVQINSSGLWGYSAGVTTTFKLNTDGSGEIGTGSNKITWSTAGVVVVPAAVIGSLTIANVGSGVVGGTYKTGAGTTRLELSSTGLVAYASGTPTFTLDGTTGSVTATGSFTIQSATSGARVVIDNAGGIEGFNASAVSTFRFNAATGAGYVGGTGSGTNGISWNSSGTVSIGGAAFSSGKITASSLSVSSLSSIAVDAGTITAGSITASVITAGTFINGSSGTINMGAADIVVNSTGKLKFGTSSLDYLANDILFFDLSAAGQGKVKFKNSGTSTNATLWAGYTSSLQESALGIFTSAPSDYSSGTHKVQVKVSYAAGATSAVYLEAIDGAGTDWTSITVDGQAGTITNYIGGVGNILVLESTNRRAKFYGYIFPGSGSGVQTTRYISDDGTYMTIVGGTLDVSAVASGLKVGVTGVAPSALPQPNKYFTIIGAGPTTYYIPVFTAANPWTQ